MPRELYPSSELTFTSDMHHKHKTTAMNFQITRAVIYIEGRAMMLVVICLCAGHDPDICDSTCAHTRVFFFFGLHKTISRGALCSVKEYVYIRNPMNKCLYCSIYADTSDYYYRIC